MRKLHFFVSIITLFSLAVSAQSNKEEIELYQSLYGMEKKAIVAGFIKLEGEANTAFWTKYDEYEAERKAIGQKRIDLIYRYAEKYAELDEVTTEQLLKESIALNTQLDKLIVKYTKSIGKVCGSKAAGQFYQLENYLRSAEHLSIMEQIPFIGELEISNQL